MTLEFKQEIFDHLATLMMPLAHSAEEEIDARGHEVVNYSHERKLTEHDGGFISITKLGMDYLKLAIETKLFDHDIFDIYTINIEM